MTTRSGETQKAELPRFHPATVVRELGHGEAPYTISDIVCHTGVWGGTGGGKTSGTGKFLALGLLGSKAEAGLIVLCSKPSEVHQWLDWAKQAGRDSNVKVFDVSGEHRFNFLEWEAGQSAAGGLTVNVVALLEEIISAIGPSGKASGGDDSGFWKDSLHQLLMAVVELVQLAGYELRMETLRDIVRSAPISREQASDAGWQEKSACWFFLEKASARCAFLDTEVQADLAECRAYFLDDYANLSEKTRSILTLMFTKLASSFTTRPMRKLFCTDITVRPEDTFDGAILIIAIDTQTYRLLGRIAAITWKFCWQVAVLRRRPASAGEYLRPVVCWADEAAENFLSDSDQAFVAASRQSVGGLVYLAQNINQYKKRLGDNDAFEALAANFQNKWFHQNTGPSNKWASELLGECWMQMRGTSANVSTPETMDAGRTSSSGVSFNLQRRFLIEPSVFTTLKRGGPAYGFEVEAILYKGGQIFSDGMPFKRMLFKQR